jgi:hypothetical protein
VLSPRLQLDTPTDTSAHRGIAVTAEQVVRPSRTSGSR